MAAAERPPGGGGRGGFLSSLRAWRPACAWCLAQLLARTHGMVAEGELPKQKNFQLYTGKFCYDFTNVTDTWAGIIKVTTYRDGPAPKGGELFFMIFDDEGKHWRKARKHWESSTCEEKRKDASLVTEIVWAPEQQKAEYSIRVREKIRPRFWYFTFVACKLEMDAPMRYKIHATNELWGWQQEFSLDHANMLQLYAVFTVLFGLGALGAAWVTRWRPSSKMTRVRQHPYVQLLLLSYVASLASCAFFLIHYIAFTRDGFGSRRVRFLGVLAAIVANCTVFLIALLSSVGWAITTHTLPGRRLFLGAITIVGGLSALCELRSEVTMDESTRLYSYQSPPGVLALMMKIFMFCWFAYQIKITYEEEIEDKIRRYYKYLACSFTIWSLNVPVMVILAFNISPWFRFKVVTTADVLARFLGQVILSQLLLGPLSPLTAENTFPARDTYGLDSAFDKLDEMGRDDF